MTTAQFSTDEWKSLLNAPHWVFVAMTAAERTNIFAKGTEAKGLEVYLSGFQTGSALVKEIIARQKEADRKIEGTLQDAERMLGQVNTLLERKVSMDEADAVRDFLMGAGEAIAKTSHEQIIGTKTVSDTEQATLTRIQTALKATEADKRYRHEAAARDQAAKAAQQAKEAEARAAAERQRQEAARAAAQKAAEEAEAKRKAEEAAAQKAAAEAAAKKLAAEAEARRLVAEAEAKRRAEEAEARRLMEEAAAKKAAEEAAAKKAAEEAAAQKAAAEAAAKSIGGAVPAAGGERIYVVKPGDTLSGIAQQVYGKAGRWREIFEANKDVIKNPNLIRPGWKLRIPG